MFACIQAFRAWTPSTLVEAGQGAVGGDLRDRGPRPSREGKDAGASRRWAARRLWPGRGREQRRRPRPPLQQRFPHTISASPKVSEGSVHIRTFDFTRPHPGTLPSSQPLRIQPPAASPGSLRDRQRLQRQQRLLSSGQGRPFRPPQAAEPQPAVQQPCCRQEREGPR